MDSSWRRGPLDAVTPIERSEAMRRVGRIGYSGSGGRGGLLQLQISFHEPGRDWQVLLDDRIVPTYHQCMG